MKLKMRRLSILFLVGMLLSGIVLIAGCHKKGKIVDGWPKRTLKGVTLTPRSFQPADLTDFFQKAGQAGEIISWAGDWDELGDTIDGAPKFLAEMTKTYAFIPMIEAQFFSQSTGQLLRPLDDSTKQRYKNSAVAFAKKYAPKYLALGIEVNVFYEKSPSDFDLFVPFYAEVYDAVKAVSPDTKIFVIFQLEKMKGLSGGLFGGVNDTSNTQWHLLNQFPKSDLIAFTTYPCMIYKNPSDIPTDYYTEIKSHTSKPVAFTEIGWHSDSSLAGWESSEVEQAEFIAKFFNLTLWLDKETVIWSFIYDQNVIEPFKSMGLRRSDGSAKPAWDAWIRAESYSSEAPAPRLNHTAGQGYPAYVDQYQKERWRET